jgi:hypothetical protein
MAMPAWIIVIAPDNARLTVYVQAHGDCNVPKGWKDNPQLASWCANQRTKYKNDKLSPDRIKRLENLDFQFTLQMIRKSK